MENNIGQRLQAIRTEQGLSQGDIEKKTGLLRSYLSRVENGHTVPSIETLGKLATALSVPIAELIDSDGKSKSEPPLTDKSHTRFWTQMRKFVPRLKERDRRVLAGLARRMAGKQ